MPEEPVFFLQAFQVSRGREGGAIKIYRIVGDPVGGGLDGCDHINIIDPVTRLSGHPIGCRIEPLAIGTMHPEFFQRGILGQPVKLERHNAEDCVVHMEFVGHELWICPILVELANELPGQFVVTGLAGQL